MRFRIFIPLILVFMFAGNVSDAQKEINVLVFSKTNGYRHEAIPDGVKAIYKLGEERNWIVTATEDSTLFTKEFLQRFDVIVFMLTGGDILNGKQQKAMEDFIRSGKGFAGIHSATVTEYEWEWYGNLVGAYFTAHPPTQKGTIIIEDPEHPCVPKGISEKWTREDEWYSFDRNPRENVHVIMTIDENSYDVDDNKWFKEKKTRMGDHPIVWSREFDGGRSFHTALGHTPGSYSDSLFLEHIAGGIEWAAGRKR